MNLSKTITVLPFIKKIIADAYISPNPTLSAINTIIVASGLGTAYINQSISMTAPQNNSGITPTSDPSPQPAPPEIHPILFSIGSRIISTPNLILLVRIFSLLRIVDDITYYSYHKTRYDEEFAFVSEFCWNLTNAKYMLPELEPVYSRFNVSYDQLISLSPVARTPEKFIRLDQNVNFLRQTEDYWMSSLPITLVTFVLLHFIAGLTTKYNWNFAKKFSLRFKYYGALSLTLIGENLQYLSFRCFSSMLEPPHSKS